MNLLENILCIGCLCIIGFCIGMVLVLFVTVLGHLFYELWFAFNLTEQAVVITIMFIFVIYVFYKAYMVSQALNKQ